MGGAPLSPAAACRADRGHLRREGAAPPPPAERAGPSREPDEPRREREPRREPEPEREPKPEPEREPEAAVDESADGELRTGILDLVAEGYGFVRVGGLTRSPEDPYVSRTLVREFGLRRGDEVTGRVVPRGQRERHGRMVTPRMADRTARRRPSASTTGPRSVPPARCVPSPERTRSQCAWPSWWLRWPSDSGRWSPARRARARRTCCATSARGLIGGEERLIVALIDVRPEEVPEWDDLGTGRGARRSRRPAAARAGGARGAGGRARQASGRAGRGRRLVLDSISRLARAYGLARSRSGSDGPTPELLAVEGAKRWFAIGARHRRGIADTARRRSRGVGVPPRDARARVAGRRGRRSRAAGP